MSQNLENLPPNWDDIKEDCEYISHSLSVDHFLQRRNPRIHHYKFRMDFQS